MLLHTYASLSRCWSVFCDNYIVRCMIVNMLPGMKVLKVCSCSHCRHLVLHYVMYLDIRFNLPVRCKYIGNMVRSMWDL